MEELKKIIDKNFEIDYPKYTDNEFVGNMYDIYEKAFKTAFKIKEEETQLQMADAQFVGFKHRKWNHSDIIGLVESMGLTKKEWNEWKKKYPKCLDFEDFEEIEKHFNTI